MVRIEGVLKGLSAAYQFARKDEPNPLWGAPRIHGELLMLDFEVAQSTVSTYIARPSI